ncbi:MAG: hypothetical protein ACJAW4_000897 [Paracoccaceae bacterium]|jgi:hypothetical protein
MLWILNGADPMPAIPEDIGPILREIDQLLKESGVPPQGRSLRAVIEFGKRFKISIPISAVPPGADIELVKNSAYTKQIYAWFSELYGERGKTDFSAQAKVAVFADGDIWELPIPLIFGTAIIYSSGELRHTQGNVISRGPVHVNACSALSHITEARLSHFTDTDLAEVYNLFCVGIDVRRAFDCFRKEHQKFIEAEDDMKTAVMHQTAQRPNYGQSRWSSLQMCEKFMKAMIEVIGDTNAKGAGHNLAKLQDRLSKSIDFLSIDRLLLDIQCESAVRYGEISSSREEAYKAHKSSLLLVSALWAAKGANLRPPQRP